MIGEINDDCEKLDPFVDALKYSLMVEVRKLGCNSLDVCAGIALSVDSATWGAERASSGIFLTHFTEKNEPTPVEIGNVSRVKSLNAHCERRRKKTSQEACFRCHKVECSL